MNVLLTGADGFLGHHIIDTLLADGHDVRVLFHKDSSYAEFDFSTQIEVSEGSLLDIDSLAEAVRGMDAVIHAAANTSFFPRRQEIVWKVNFDGTRNLVEAAQAAGIMRFVSIGTANSFGRGTLERPGDENSPYTDWRYRTDYMDSKKAVQDWLIAHVKKTGFPALIINPCFMLGPGDRKPGAGVMLLRVYGRRMLPVSPGGRNFVDVRDVARAVVNALDRGRIGECYICGNENIPYSEMFPLFARVMGMDTSVPVYLPSFLTVMFGVISDVLSIFTRKEPEVSTLVARIGCGGFYYSAEKARKELALPASSVEKAVKDHFAWFRENGYV